MYMSIITLVILEPGPITSLLVHLFSFFHTEFSPAFHAHSYLMPLSLGIILAVLYSHVFSDNPILFGRIPSQFHIIKLYSYSLCLHIVFPKQKGLSISSPASVFLFASRSSSTCFTLTPFSNSPVRAAPYKVRH